MHLGTLDHLELTGQEVLPGRPEYYPCQSTKTFLEDYFEMNLPVMLDFGHTTSNLNTDQMMQSARAVGLEVTLASYVLLEMLKLRARCVSGLGVREQRGHNPFPSLNGSTVADSVASHSKY